MPTNYPMNFANFQKQRNSYAYESTLCTVLRNSMENLNKFTRNCKSLITTTFRVGTKLLYAYDKLTAVEIPKVPSILYSSTHIYICDSIRVVMQVRFSHSKSACSVFGTVQWALAESSHWFDTQIQNHSKIQFVRFFLLSFHFFADTFSFDCIYLQNAVSDSDKHNGTRNREKKPNQTLKYNNNNHNEAIGTQ